MNHSRTMIEAWCELSRDMRQFRDDLLSALRLPGFVEWLSRKIDGGKS